MRIAILGGGLTGLVLAYYLQKAGVAYDVFEGNERAGGNLHSPRVPEGYQLEAGPNSLLLSPELEALLNELGLADRVQEAAPVSQRRYVLRGGRYRELPGSPPRLLTSNFFSLKARLQIVRELFRPAAPAADPAETVGQFFRRRFGAEVVDYAVNPFVAGIYAAAPDELLLSLTFPQLRQLEQTHGSVLRGLAQAQKGGRRRRTVTLRGGVQALTDALAAQLTNLRRGSIIEGIRREHDGAYAVLHTSRAAEEGSAPPEAASYTHLALALPAAAAAELLRPHFPAAAQALAAVHYPPLALVYSAYDRAQVAHPLNGFGALHPRVENAYAAGSIWTSSIFPDRVPTGQVLFTTFVGGTQYEAHARQPEAAQLAAVHAELSRLYGIAGAPRWQGRYFWEQSIPLFDHRVAAARAAVAALAPQGVLAVANWQAGVSVPDCVRHAQATAAALAG